jgi:transposase
MGNQEGIAERFRLLSGVLDERLRRWWAGAEAAVLGRGGISAVAEATGLDRGTVRIGLKEIREGPDPALSDRIRRAGGGRKRSVDQDPTLQSDLESLVEPTTRGDPESPLRWTCKSVRVWAEELGRMGPKTHRQNVSELLHELGYSLQANRKSKEGASHPDRNAQFEHIDRTARAHLRSGDPVISVDTKKKELVGDFKNAGQEWRPQGEPERVRTHDFVIPELGRAVPYGVYDLAQNTGWVSVGVDHDTATFAVETIRRGWYSMGRPIYPEAKRLRITADSGGSNGSKVRLWKVELQALSTEIGIPIGVCHFPPGTSQWNKIEHRLFSFITRNWRGRPLLSHATLVSLIAATTTKTGLRVRSRLDPNLYPLGEKVSAAELARVLLQPHRFRGEWNYTIHPGESVK